MRGRGTWLVLVGVVAIAVAAGYDAFGGRSRGSEATSSERPPPPPPQAQPTTPDAALVEAGLSGSLVYSDRRCELQLVTLPGLRRQDTGTSGCSFVTSPGGAVAPGPLVPSPNGELAAACEAGRVELREAEGPILARAPGCAPAWRPDGTLTAVRSGEVVALRGRRLETSALISLRDLRRAVGRPPWALFDPHAREVAWIDDEVAAVVVSDPGRTRDDVIALFRGRRLLAAPPFPYERLSGLRVSPRGSYVAARIGTPPTGLLVLDRAGDLRPVPFRVASAIAWSRDERWSAAATATGIYVWETESRGNRFVRIPVEARDVFWR